MSWRKHSAVIAALVASTAWPALAEQVVLSSEADGITLSGELLAFENGTYRLQTAIGEIVIDAEKVTCAGPGCPVEESAEPEPEIVMQATPGEPVTLITESGTVRLNGTLVSFADGIYEIDTTIGRLEVQAEGSTCEGPGCPVPVEVAAAPKDDPADLPETETPAEVAEPLPVKTEFTVPLAELSGEPALEIGGAASVIETLLPRIADDLAKVQGGSIKLLGTQQADSAIAAQEGAPAGSLGLEWSDASGTAQAILARLSEGGPAGDADITFTSAPYGDDIAGEAGKSLGLEPLVPVVSPQNPLFAVSAEDLAAIFGGDIQNWRAVGGSDGAIRVLALAPPHDLTAALRTQVAEPFGRSLSPQIERVATTAELLRAVEEDSGAIGFVGASQAGALKVLSILDTCQTPIAATAGNVKSGRYPYARQLMVEAKSTDGLAGTLLASLDTVVGDGGEAALIPTGTGAYPLDDEIGQLRDSLNRIDDRFARLNAANALRMMTVADKMSIALRFEDGTNRFASDAAEVLDEVMAYAGDKGLTEIFLVGFSEDTGNVDRNRDLARNAADLARRELLASDTGGTLSETLVRTIGLGAIAPLACDDEHKYRNRRVEIWVRR